MHPIFLSFAWVEERPRIALLFCFFPFVAMTSLNMRKELTDVVLQHRLEQRADITSALCVQRNRPGEALPEAHRLAEPLIQRCSHRYIGDLISIRAIF
jgi:hypothetical protein